MPKQPFSSQPNARPVAKTKVSARKRAAKVFAIYDPETTPRQLTLKCDPEHGEVLRAEHRAIGPGYHMNKRHWITVTLDGSLAPTLIEELIEDSFDLVAPLKKR